MEGKGGIFGFVIVSMCATVPGGEKKRRGRGQERNTWASAKSLQGKRGGVKSGFWNSSPKEGRGACRVLLEQ